MKMISIREMKANWSEIERQIAQGETFEVLHHGKPTAHIIAPQPRKVFKWDNHIETALSCPGKTGAETVESDREGRW